MSVAPIIHTVRVKAAPARAFDLFTARMGDWWPRGGTIGAKPHVTIVLEPAIGGRWFERDADGHECPWGEVLAWEPPKRVLLAWKLNSRFEYDPDFETELEITVEPAEGGGSQVTLEHRNLERFGDAAERIAGQMRGGWLSRFNHYAAFADANP